MAHKIGIMSLRMLHLTNETNASCPDLVGQNYRASFHTHSSAKGPRKKIYHAHLDGKGPRKGERAVVKMFRDAAGTEDMCDIEIDKHKLARRLAKKFNKNVPDHHYKIQFTLPLKSTVERLGVGFYLTRHKSRHLDKKEWVLIEENLDREGDYQIFIRKTGERLSKDPTTLDAFMHFTFHESKGQYLMCGFQGVQTHDGYLLTTPCIHSTDKSFGKTTDKGPKAIKKVFEKHRCNNLCYSFLKPGADFGKEIPEEEENEDSMDDDDASGSGSKAGDVSTSRDASAAEDVGMEIVHHETSTIIDEPIEETEEEHEEREKRRMSINQGVRRKDSKKGKEGAHAHRSNVEAVGELKKQPSMFNVTTAKRL